MAGLKPALACLLLAGWAGMAAAQSLPAPSRTMYKCTANKVTSYSDKPCVHPAPSLYRTALLSSGRQFA